MRNQKGVSLIALVITIIVIIILAAIVMNAGSDTTGRAQYSKFSSDFAGYAEAVQLQGLNVKQTLGTRGQVINDAQQNFMTAEGITIISGDAFNRTMPVGYYLTDTLMDIMNIKDSGDAVAYVIDDEKIPGYEDAGTMPTDGSAAKEFYGDSNGKEYHFVTSNSHVFTLPGYPVEQNDGTIEYHISNEDGYYYVVTGNSDLDVGDTNVNGDTITEDKPIIAKYIENNQTGLDQDNVEVKTQAGSVTVGGEANKTNVIKY